MNQAQMQALAKEIAPVIKRHIAGATDPLASRIAALEAAISRLAANQTPKSEEPK